MKRIIATLGFLVLIVVTINTESIGKPPTTDLPGTPGYDPYLGIPTCWCPDLVSHGCYCRITN